MRVLLTWELGLNYGHLTRLLPLAQRLKTAGDAVLVAARDMHAASVVLGPAGIPFVQAPHLPQGIALDHRAAGYSDVLLSQGWSNCTALSGLVQGWLTLFRLFRPDKLLLDYSPTVSLAARIAKLPTVLIGNGFELPPLTDPLPPFPEFSWATSEIAGKSERRAIANASAILKRCKAPQLSGLRDLFTSGTCLFATCSQLDHYGARDDAEYIGPLLGDLPNASRVDWPEGVGPRIFASVRPDTSHVRLLLEVLAGLRGRVVCVAPGFSDQQLAALRRPHMVLAARPVQLDRLLDADLCLTYGAEGTMMTFLRAGVPQLVSPWHVEAFMSARRIRAAGLGVVLEGKQTAESIRDTISQACNDPACRESARAFLDRPSRECRAADRVLKEIQLFAGARRVRRDACQLDMEVLA